MKLICSKRDESAWTLRDNLNVSVTNMLPFYAMQCDGSMRAKSPIRIGRI